MYQIIKFHICFIFGCNLDVRDAINAIFIGVDEDGGNGKAKKNKSTQESDLSDWYEPEHEKCQKEIESKYCDVKMKTNDK